MGQRKLGPTRETGSLMFSVGKKVEVSFDRDGCRDAWFPSTVLEDCGNGSFLVEYRRPGCEDEAVVGEVTVDSFHIRPCPPHIKSNNFNVLEKVDAYYDFGWWSGVITKELIDSRYVVFFKNTNRLKELSDPDLRPHMDWKDGKWFTTLKGVSNPTDCQTNRTNNCKDTIILQEDVPRGRAINVNEISEERTQLSLKYVEDLTATYLTNEISQETVKNALSNSDAVSSQHLELVKEGTEAPKMSLEACKFRAKPSQTPRALRTPRTKSLVGYSSPNSGYAGMRISVPVALQPDNCFPQKRVGTKCQELGEGKGGTPEKVLGPNSTPKSTERGKKTDVPVIIGLECSNVKVTSSRAKRSRQIDNESLEPLGDKKQIDAAIEGIQESKQLGDGQSSQKKKRGRLSMKQISTPTDMAQIGDHIKDKCLGHAERPIMVFEDGEEQQQEVQMGRNGKRGRTRKLSLTKMSNEKAVQSFFQLPGKHYMKRGKRQPRRANIESRAQGSVDTSGVKTTESNRIASDGEEVLTEAAPYNGFDDQPLAKWFEEMQSPTVVDGLRVSPACSPKQCAEAREKQDMPTQTPVNMTPTTQTENQSLPFAEMREKQGMPTQNPVNMNPTPQTETQSLPFAEMREKQDMPTRTPVSMTPTAQTETQNLPFSETRQKEDTPMQTSVNMTPTTQTETQNLPFVKNTLLWATIESMDIFRRIPQKPHFRPLEHCKESSREGLAIGCMVTFSSIVEKAFSLQYDSPRSTIEDILETLSDLENHGFDVQLVRNRSTELLSMKDKHEKLEAQAADIDNQIIKHSTDRKYVDGEIEEINRQIAELQNKLSLAISRKEINDREMEALRSQLENIQAEMKNTLDEFGGFTSKLL